jgi:PPOX class probable F420-dependent enzyme
VRRNLTIEELGDLVELPLLAILATHRSDGRILLSPVWHEWRDGGFTVVTGSRGIKTQHLRRDPRASIVVADPAPPYRGVEVEAEARLTTDGAAETARRIATRYLGEEGGAAYADGATDDQLIRLEPGRLRAWDFADDFGT